MLQDTFVTAWRSAGTHRGAEAAWLALGDRRPPASVDAQRTRARTERVAQAEQAGGAEWTAAVPSAEDRVLAGLEYGDVGAALDRISPELREVLRATVIDGLTTREAARLLGIPEGTVKTRAMRARRELRAALDRLLVENGPLGGTA